MITINFIHLVIIGTGLLGIITAVVVKWPKAERVVDKLKASELAAKLLGEPVKLPTMYTNENGARTRVIAWEEGAGAHVQNEVRLLGAALQYLNAEGRCLRTTDPSEVEALSREAVLWWHGCVEDDVPEGV